MAGILEVTRRGVRDKLAKRKTMRQQRTHPVLQKALGDEQGPFMQKISGIKNRAKNKVSQIRNRSGKGTVASQGISGGKPTTTTTTTGQRRFRGK